MFNYWRTIDHSIINALEVLCSSWSLSPRIAERILLVAYFGLAITEEVREGTSVGAIGWVGFALLGFAMYLASSFQQERLGGANPFKHRDLYIFLRMLMVLHIISVLVTTLLGSNVLQHHTAIKWLLDQLFILALYMLCCEELPKDPWWKRLGQKKLASQAT